MECKCETCVRKDCADRTKQDDLRMVIACSDYLNTERQMTNADRIRAMTDEELAKECVKQFPMYLWPTDVRTIYFDFDNHNKNNAINAWIKWLKQPAEGDA